MGFGRAFESQFISQEFGEERDIMELTWDGSFEPAPREELDRLSLNWSISTIQILKRAKAGLEDGCKAFSHQGQPDTGQEHPGPCRQGYELLDKKRNILIREMMSLVDKAREIRDEMQKTFQKAYRALQLANVTLGISVVEQIGYAVPKTTAQRSGAEHHGSGNSHCEAGEADLQPRYGFRMTNSTLDTARQEFSKAKYLAAELAEVENAVYRLAANIRRTQKRTNALKNIMIPGYEEAVKNIVNVLEEKDREEFSRLKVIKRVKYGG